MSGASQRQEAGHRSAGSVAFCLSVFKSDNDRSLYENSLAQQGLRALEPLLLQAGQAEKCLKAGVIEELLRLALENGADKDEAIAYILDFARKRAWRWNCRSRQRWNGFRSAATAASSTATRRASAYVDRPCASPVPSAKRSTPRSGRRAATTSAASPSATCSWCEAGCVTRPGPGPR